MSVKLSRWNHVQVTRNSLETARSQRCNAVPFISWNVVEIFFTAIFSGAWQAILRVSLARLTHSLGLYINFTS